MEKEPPLKAFIALLNEAIRKDGDFSLLKEANLQGVLTGFGYKVNYINKYYKVYTYWKEEEVDVSILYEFSGYDKGEFDRVLSQVEKIGLPRGRYSLSISFYLYEILVALGKIGKKYSIEFKQILETIENKETLKPEELTILKERMTLLLKVIAKESRFEEALELISKEELTEREQERLDRMISEMRRILTAPEGPPSPRGVGAAHYDDAAFEHGDAEPGDWDGEWNRAKREITVKNPETEAHNGGIHGAPSTKIAGFCGLILGRLQIEVGIKKLSDDVYTSAIRAMSLLDLMIKNGEKIIVKAEGFCNKQILEKVLVLMEEYLQDEIVLEGVEKDRPSYYEGKVSKLLESMYKKLTTPQEIQDNVKKMTPVLTQVFIEWTRKETVLALDTDLGYADEVRELFQKYIIDTLTQIHGNNDDINVLLKNLTIIDGKGENLAKRIAAMTDPKRGKIKKENVIMITTEDNLKNCGAFKEKAFITAVQDSSLSGNKKKRFDYYPFVEITFFAVLRSLTYNEDEILKYQKRLWKWYRQIPNIEKLDFIQLLGTCLEVDDTPRRTVILKLVPNAEKIEHEELEDLYRQIQEFIRKA
jgi:phosphotransferase system HPr-like phosphotransfer protein